MRICRGIYSNSENRRILLLLPIEFMAPLGESIAIARAIQRSFFIQMLTAKDSAEIYHETTKIIWSDQRAKEPLSDLPFFSFEYSCPS